MRECAHLLRFVTMSLFKIELAYNVFNYTQIFSFKTKKCLNWPFPRNGVVICGLVKTRPSLSHHVLKKEEYQVKITPEDENSDISNLWSVSENGQVITTCFYLCNLKIKFFNLGNCPRRLFLYLIILFLCYDE